MAETEVVKTKNELLVDMKTATDSGDWKAVSKVSGQIAKLVAGEEKARKDAQQDAVAQQTEAIKKTLDKVIAKLVESVPADQLEAMDGVWYSNDFGEKLSTCRLVKGTVRKSGGGSSGGGKKFSITTTELLAKHGSEQMGESGKTFQEAYDGDEDGNARYKVRMKMLKVDGQLS